MRDNWSTCLATPRLFLLPYRRRFVPTYHAWMADPFLLSTTSSDRLSLPEELAAQASWLSDPQKCTFIVFDRALHAAVRAPLASHCAGMCGDVNLFLLDARAAAEDYFGGAAVAGGAAEVMVMIAEPSLRRRGYAAEAVAALLRYGAEALSLRYFIAKISADNAPSLALFEKLGFAVAKRVPAFEEVHMAWEWGSSGGGVGGDAGSAPPAWELLPCPQEEGEE